MNERALRDRALEWQVILWSGEVTERERRDFESWRASDPEHEKAWLQVQHALRHLQVVPDTVASQVLRASKPALSRRSLVRGICLAVGAGVLGHGASQTPQWQSATADYSTARGVRRNLTLPDGSRAALNTASAVDLHFGARERRLFLHRGEILIDTASEPRSFIVATRVGSIRALGTRFAVQRLEGMDREKVMVQVFEGAVELSPRLGGKPLRLDAGQQARFDSRAAEIPLALAPSAASWIDGVLIAERWRLADFLLEISRYRSGIVRCDPAVADLVVSGVYPLDDTDRILQSLAQALPVRLHTATRYWVTVTAL